MQGSFVDKLLDLMPRLVTSKPSEVVKILQTTLRQSTFLHLPLPEQVSLECNSLADCHVVPVGPQSFYAPAFCSVANVGSSRDCFSLPIISGIVAKIQGINSWQHVK